MERDIQKTEHHLKSSAKNTQSNVQPLKSQTSRTVHWAHNSSTKGLQLYMITPFYLAYPDMLSLVGEPLLGDRCGSPNHIQSFSFTYYFIYSVYSWYKMKVVLYPVKEWNNFFIKITKSLVLPHLDCSRTQLLSHWTASIHSTANVPLLNLSRTYHQRFLNIRWQNKLTMHGHEPCVIDASKTNKQVY